MADLTKKDIDILIDALDAWEQKDLAGNMLMGLLGLALAGDDAEVRSKLKEEETARRFEMEAQTRERKETSLLLKAKLIQIKQDSIIAEANNLVRG